MTKVVFENHAGAVRHHAAYVSRLGKAMPEMWSAWSKAHPFGFQFASEAEAVKWLRKQ